MKTKRINIIILIAASAAIFGWVLYEDGWQNLVHMFSMLNPCLLTAAAGMMVIYWLLESLILHKITKCFYPNQKFQHSFHTSMVGQLFNNITPSASGGQPMQAYDMVRQGIPLGIASSVLLIKFIIYQLCMTTYCAIILIRYWHFFAVRVTSFGYLVFLGFSVHMAVMLGLLCVGFFPRFTTKLANGIYFLGVKFHFIKEPERVRAYIDRELAGFHESFRGIKSNKKTMLTAAVITVVQLTVFYLVPYFICLAFGIRSLTIFVALAAEAFVNTIASMVPLPGGEGGAEYSFYVFFRPFFAHSGVSINLAMLLWRLITFFLPTLVGTFITFGHPSKKAG